MARTDTAQNTTPVQDLKTDPEKAAQPEYDLGGETERDTHDATGPASGGKSGHATKMDDAGPPDGGTAAWLVVLGAWCCSFSGPGWLNSACFPYSHCLPRFPVRGIQRL